MLVGKVGRRRPRARLAMLSLYGVLLVGAATTVYPFLLMISTGFKGPTDQNDNTLIPIFWGDDAELFDKYRDDKYAGDLSMMASTEIGPEADADTLADYERFLLDLPVDRWHAGFRTPGGQVTSRLQIAWQDWLIERYDSIEDLNVAYDEVNTGFRTVVPVAELFDRPGWSPDEDAKWRDWVEFKSGLPAEMRVPIRGERLFQEWLRDEFENSVAAVPIELRGSAEAFEEIHLPASGAWRDRFLAERLPDRYGGVTTEALWDRGDLPNLAFEREHVAQNAAAIRWEMSLRNYRYVFDYVAINGRALWNTAVFCGLTILLQLTVNPLAAYALSRYPMRATGKILLFLLATMAFPAEVAMIPSFLLLKDLGLLNTFAALVLPGVASGFSIFLLKGFFDSLPREVFESGQIDGAPEWIMMLRLALPLSKPVLGYMALLAFMGAYGAFMYAFLVAQDRDMWTLMVFVYQLQSVAPKAVMMAAITLAALPSVLVFLAAQRVIMRGIVLPGER